MSEVAGQQQGSTWQARHREELAFGGLHVAQTWTGTPFLALLTRPVMGVNLTGASPPPLRFPMGLIGVLNDDDDEAAA